MNVDIIIYDGPVDAVVDLSSSALRVSGSINARKYLYGHQIAVPGLVVCACEMYLHQILIFFLNLLLSLGMISVSWVQST